MTAIYKLPEILKASIIPVLPLPTLKICKFINELMTLFVYSKIK
jgi:hypothetical protein